MLQKYEGMSVTDENGNEIPIVNDVEVLNKLMQNNNVDLRGHMVFNKDGKEVINFGKHKGTLVIDVLKKEPSFYDWILKGEFPLDTKRKLTEIKLRMFNSK